MVFSPNDLENLIEIVDGFFIMNESSASKLLETILRPISRISGITLNFEIEPIYFGLDGDNADKKVQNLLGFLEYFEENVMNTRKCHLGLQTLILDCKKWVKKYLNKKKFMRF